MAATDYSGQTIEGRYRVDHLLGEGGMGSVYLGRHIVIGKKVAIKFLHAELADKEDVVKRFYREAQAAAAIGHKNIIDVMDVGVSTQGDPYLVMEYLEGESLSGMLKRAGTIDLAAACGIIEPILLALAAAHEKGIIHRDLKPENIFLVSHPGEAPAIKLIDFGISKFTRGTGQSHLTQTGSLLGTPSYMSPEQARGASDIDHRADIYSMGVILYEMLTGELPFVGEHYNQLLIKVLTEDPRPPGQVCADFPAEAEPLVMKALSKNPGKRPQSAPEMLNAIKRLGSYDQRQERLTHLASGITEKSFAGGDLGETVSSQGSGGVASDVYAQMSGKGTPRGWSDTAARFIQRRGLVIGMVSLAVVAVMVMIGVLSSGPGDGKKAVVVPVAPPASAPPPAASTGPVSPKNGVKIEILGTPEGAKIYYDDSMILDNPFRVRRERVIVRLRIEAAGYEPYKLSIIPSKDRRIKVSMKPVAKDETAPPKRSPVSARKKEKVKSVEKTSTRKPARPKRRVSKASRGAVVAEDFE